jgi:transposase
MKYTIKQFQKEFPDDGTCLAYIFDLKYGGLTKCPWCGKTKSFYKVKNRKCYACAFCAYQISPTANTIFHKSSTKLTLWFYAIYLASQSKNGVSAKELERQLGVTYKCAWRIASKIRELMSPKTNDRQLDGIVEADETYIGGVKEIKPGTDGIRKSQYENKTPVVGLVERKGDVRAKVTSDTSVSTVQPLIRKNVSLNALLVTDEASSYKTIKRHGYSHMSVNHGKKEFVKGKIHTNTIEGFWSQMKRSIDGTYHFVSPKYLQKYVDEFAFRYNHRSYPMFDVLLQQIYR